MISVAELAEAYERDFRAYMAKPSEEGLAAAYGGGRLALGGGIGLIDFAEMHWRVYERIVHGTNVNQAETDLSVSFFEEAVTPYEMALLGYKDSSQVLQRANDQLERVNLMKTRFFNYLNHELRTPLNSILGFAELLGVERAGPLTDVQRRYQSNIISGGMHMLALVNEMLDMAKIDAGKMQVAEEEVDLAFIISSAVEQTASIAAKSGVSVVFAPTARLPSVGDPHRLLQVFLNILANALKFTPSGGRVTIVATVLEDGLIVDVSDSGIGIPADKLEEIFDEFAQAEPSDSDAFLGTGLGLPLTRALLKLMNGSITARSVPGEGSTFSMTFPPAVARAPMEMGLS